MQVSDYRFIANAAACGQVGLLIDNGDLSQQSQRNRRTVRADDPAVFYEYVHEIRDLYGKTVRPEWDLSFYRTWRHYAFGNPAQWDHTKFPYTEANSHWLDFCGANYASYGSHWPFDGDTCFGQGGGGGFFGQYQNILPLPQTWEQSFPDVPKPNEGAFYNGRTLLSADDMCKVLQPKYAPKDMTPRNRPPVLSDAISACNCCVDDTFWLEPSTADLSAVYNEIALSITPMADITTGQRAMNLYECSLRDATDSRPAQNYERAAEFDLILKKCSGGRTSWIDGMTEIGYFVTLVCNWYKTETDPHTGAYIIDTYEDGSNFSYAKGVLTKQADGSFTAHFSASLGAAWFIATRAASGGVNHQPTHGTFEVTCNPYSWHFIGRSNPKAKLNFRQI